MNATMRFLLSGLLALVCLGIAGSGAWAQTAEPAKAAPGAVEMKASPVNGPPAGFVAPAEPRADETAAQRMKSQPGNNAPFWRAVRESGESEGTVNLPGIEQGVLIQRFVQYPGSTYTNAGEAWRQVRNRWLIPYGGSLVLIVAVAIGLFYWRRGPMGEDHPDGGRIERFTPLERAAHWVNAIAFVTLALSGLVIAFGKFFLLPLIGGALFGGLTYALKNVHNFVGPLFAVSLLIVIVTFLRDNLPRQHDWAWIRRGGGLLDGHPPPSHRFNAGEKGIFWVGVFFLGLVVIGSGLVLDKLVPGLSYTRGAMQIAHLFHAVGAMLMICAFLGHIYMGTIGMKGAWRAMRTGYVSDGWAREHHELWHDDIRAGRIPAQRSGPSVPASAPAVAVATRKS